jgi:hypothetical protein
MCLCYSSAFELTTEQERKKKGLTLIPEDMGTLLKILTLPSEEMLDCERKGKLPTWKRHQMEVRTLAKRVVDRRMMDYPTSIQVRICIVPFFFLRNI